MPASISLANLVPQERQTPTLRLAIRLLDRLVGVKEMDRIYREHKMQGLTKEAFAQTLLQALNVNVSGSKKLHQTIPKTGPVVIASNHPFGGIEGVILCLLIGEIRPDLKVLANHGLKLFPELSDYFIFTNPLSTNDPKNIPSLRASIEHVKQDRALLIFPAGKVSYYNKDTHRISDHKWNRIVASVLSHTNAMYLPVFISGNNSSLFYRIERVYFRLRMLFLARELLNKQNTEIQVSCGSAVKNSLFPTIPARQKTALCRVLSYCQDPSWDQKWPSDTSTDQTKIAAAENWQVIKRELSALPSEQHLLFYKDYEVYYGYQSQLPRTTYEIARLRESVFRLHNEGSGEPIDTDKYDKTYIQLFVVNKSKRHIVGAYRLGRTDQLLQNGGMTELYLSKMFRFTDQFVNQQQPCLELGRSFLTPEYQRSFQGLYLLWRGIGAFVCRFPQYRTLYGTVSLSKMYSTRSVSVIQHALITNCPAVTANTSFDFPLHPELQQYADEFGLDSSLSAILSAIEPDGKDVPILVKHYQKLGANFHCLGIDSNFNHTPGLLLSVDLPKAPDKLLKLYLGDQWQAYQNYQFD